MIVLTTKEWLMRGWKLNREIDKLIEAREAYRAMLTSVTANPSGDVVQSTKDPHKFDRLAEYDDALGADIAEYDHIMWEIQTTIHKVRDSRYRLLLLDRYTLFKTWEQIAVDECYNIRHVWRLHGEALKAAEPIVKERIHEEL